VAESEVAVVGSDPSAAAVAVAWFAATPAGLCAAAKGEAEEGAAGAAAAAVEGGKRNQRLAPWSTSPIAAPLHKEEKKNKHRANRSNDTPVSEQC
jgi:hypothetical protein